MTARSIFLLPRLLALCLCLRPAPAQEGAERRADLCKLPPEQGPCRGRIPRFYYNASSKRCELFMYGGCQGNANNFKTEEDCVAACGDRAVCKLQSDPGPCDALVPRWFHNPQARKCESFNYGSCGGNGNNFKTEEACLRLCQGTVECPPPTLRCVWSFPPLCGPRRPCAPGKTCCYHQCQFQCLDLLKEKAGTCPPDPVRCSQPQPNECGRDYECSAQLKCCHWRCARRCVEPVQE
ncbi:kunitz-type serine protease inhibitor bitisilin-3-like [Alligator sinensis]|uniref:Kunitz-type serine protease inhibitor bitisilin-3-like n=1 Tax=Alligator sinensis TaxID=38654 RepID=A0A1U7S6V1_ALLSI|nr:kunitz-type serine protease inhibitor bitisilin-3-like [Alligator sinensis]